MIINRVKWEELSELARLKCLARPALEQSVELADQVRAILAQVRGEGDSAVLACTEKFDGVKLTNGLRVSVEEIRAAYAMVGTEAMTAIREAIRRIRVFHQAELPGAIDIQVSPGVRCERRYLPIPSVGLYIPGGTAPLPSTVMMLGVPALIAGCKRRVMATPPRKDGSIDPHILVTADLLEIGEIYKMGGAQAIAALAYGTSSVPKVDKVFGPGNAYVTEAKTQVSQDARGAAIDMPAGPSEVLVIADQAADPSFVAADLLSQAEHGEDSQVVLISNSSSLLDEVIPEIDRQLRELPRRAIATKALSKSVVIEVRDLELAIELSNLYAPEHLIIQTADARALAQKVQNAGSVFIGAWSPESVGDYASGTNHVLPTYGFARAYGGVTTESFMKSVTYQELSIPGFQLMAPVVETLAEIEGLRAHRQAVTIRVRALAGRSLGR